MTLRNPWIDPRVEQVQAAQLLAYLMQRGWQEAKANYANMRTFRVSRGKALVHVPMLEDADDFVRFIIEAVTQLARVEDRFAGDVLTDLLSASAPTDSTPAISPRVHKSVGREVKINSPGE